MVRPPDFEARYAANPDPWDVRGSWYERRKESVVLAALSRERYEHAWDAACGTGSLALALARRCARVTASDASPRAVELTAGLADDAARVAAVVSVLPEAPDLGRPDLVVLAEVLYYLPAEQRRATHATALEVAAPGGEVVSVHWRHHPDDTHLSGQAATEELGDALEGAGWQRQCWHDDRDFVLGSWVAP